MARMWLARLHFVPARFVCGIFACVTASWTLGVAAPAFADPIVITGGGVSLPAIWIGQDPPFGWDLTGDRTSLGGITFDQFGGPFVNAGDVINLSNSFGVSASPFRTGPFEQTVNGVTYRSVFLSGTINFVAAPGILTSADAGVFDRPFTMDGSMSLFRGDPADPFVPGEELLTFLIAGRGTASMRLAPHAGALAGASLSYTFADPPPDPTPEPGTLVLLGSGLLVAMARARNARRRQIL